MIDRVFTDMRITVFTIILFKIKKKKRGYIAPPTLIRVRQSEERFDILLFSRNGVTSVHLHGRTDGLGHLGILTKRKRAMRHFRSYSSFVT